MASVSTRASWSNVSLAAGWSLSARRTKRSRRPPSVMTPRTFRLAQQLPAPFRQAGRGAAVGHDAEDFQVGAAVARAFSAGVAGAAVHVGFDGAAVAGLDVCHALAD